MPDKSKSKSKKCFGCKHKLKLISYDCKCEHKFCINCLTPETHNCKFNYVEEQKKKLGTQLIKVIKPKIQVI